MTSTTPWHSEWKSAWVSYEYSKFHVLTDKLWNEVPEKTKKLRAKLHRLEWETCTRKVHMKPSTEKQLFIA